MLYETKEGFYDVRISAELGIGTRSYSFELDNILNIRKNTLEIFEETGQFSFAYAMGQSLAKVYDELRFKDNTNELT